MFKKLFLHEKKHLFDGKEIDSKLSTAHLLVTNPEYESSSSDEDPEAFERKLLRTLHH